MIMYEAIGMCDTTTVDVYAIFMGKGASERPIATLSRKESLRMLTPKGLQQHVAQ